MEFEWDEAKNRLNVEKHGVSFHDACQIFQGFTFDVIDDRVDYGEDRVISIGMIRKVAIIVVVHTDRNGTCRIISARPAKQVERKLYHEALQKALDT